MRGLRCLLLWLGVLAVHVPVHAGSFEDFFHAVRVDNAGGVVALLRRGFDPNAQESSGQTALTMAVQEDAAKVIDALLQHPQLNVNALNHAGESALMLAALKGDLALVQRLVARGGNVNQPGWSALHYAASGPEPAVVAWLLERGANVEALSPNGTTPLMMAAGYGNQQSVDVLLARKASTAARNSQGLNAADFARRAGRDRLIERLGSRSR